tara:strand:+ start:796 stop:1548 length:753 start_codon:yes stop_codon:yes gene_type:complete
MNKELPIIKKNIEEAISTTLSQLPKLQNKPIFFALDISGSCWFNLGRNPYAKEMKSLVQLMGTIFEKNGHEIGACFFTDQIELYQAPKDTSLALILETFSTIIPVSTETDIVHSLETLMRYCTQDSLIIVISDFNSHFNSLFLESEQNSLVTKDTHIILPIVLNGSASDHIPKLGLLSLEDPESGEHVIINTYSKETRAKYDAIQEVQRLYRRRFFSITGWRSIDLNTKTDLTKQFHNWAASLSDQGEMS